MFIQSLSRRILEFGAIGSAGVAAWVAAAGGLRVEKNGILRYVSRLIPEAQMSEMVERVARAIKSGRGCDPENVVPCPFCLWGPDDMTADFDETGCMWLTRAAIEEMRAPTEAMVDAGNLEASVVWSAVWDSMISAALDTEPAV